MKTLDRPSLFATLSLRSGQVWSHEGGHPPLHLRCLSGELWLVARGGDRVLRPGDTWACEQPGRVVVEAFAPSRVAVLIGAPEDDERIEAPASPGHRH